MTALPPLEPAVAGAMAEAADVLRHAESVSVVCHVWPDGDALGSLLGLSLALASQGRKVHAAWGDPVNEVPSQYSWLPGSELIGPLPDPPGVALCLDCATADRLGKVRAAVESASVLVNVDHHVSNTRFGAINVVDPGAPSTSELALRLLMVLDAPIGADVALALYTGLVTDTGRFSYASATPRAFAAAAALVERGVDVAALNQRVYETVPFGYQKILGRVLGRCVLESDPPCVRSHLTQEDLAEGNLSMDDTDDFIDYVRRVDTDVALLLKQTSDGNWKGSLRSRGATDVGSVAQRLGGGGHTLAAGFTLEVTTLSEAERIVLDELRSAREP